MNEKVEEKKVLNLKKEYVKPTLLNMGSMQKVTLGGSEVHGDSGGNPPLMNP
jgi:hypothetical protein